MITINEIWKDVRNFEGEYQVSTLNLIVQNYRVLAIVDCISKPVTQSW